MARLARPPKKVKVDLNIAPLMLPVSHGRHDKDMVVLHETVSPDYERFADILGVARYMPRHGLGIHGIVDGEGYLGWAVAGDTWLLYHTASEGGGVNTRSIGIEQVSRVMVAFPDNKRRFEWWWEREKQIDKVAKVLAYCHRVHDIPLRYSDGAEPGITTHWQVTRTFDVDGGHTDCWPRHLGGYYPVLRVIRRAQWFAKRGW